MKRRALKRLAILAAPIIWRKIRARRSRRYWPPQSPSLAWSHPPPLWTPGTPRLAVRLAGLTTLPSDEKVTANDDTSRHGRIRRVLRCR